ncbi:MAG: type I 3-dehydroquinate dehydratase [Candidatus Altiarchaeales archaeon]|nr:MAG: type I 3-dehydroquinate dehydratase [Candidatus Altiarchaeales archaeon]HDO82272.1 type I 3-dehydroquinate dehydratase [Candidatus Altiarchaeales archaeon]HEX54921.1 type I 3-dehydroquinate dehydratase [Candidatus Altiarchaeales archaeon]
MICASITENRLGDMVRLANSSNADLVELRLDYVSDIDEISQIGKIEKPVIVTCMPRWEGGNFDGSDEKRINILLKALDFSEYITVELMTEKRLRDGLIERARENNKKVILSYHDFNGTPPINKILEILERERGEGADIAKVAFMPRNYEDVLEVMRALVIKKNDNKFGIPIIAVSMGEIGKVSRILAPILGSYLTYASIEKGRESAPGQLTVNELRQILRILK